MNVRDRFKHASHRGVPERADASRSSRFVGRGHQREELQGNTCLHFCWAFGYGDTLGKYLISKGADSTVRNNESLTCYEGLAK